MLLSVCGLQKGYPTSFSTSEDSSFERHAKRMTESVWSHITWAAGVRNEDCFACSDYLALDFDEGPTILDFVAKAEGYTYAIGPSKSHQIEKISESGGSKKPACDRFRVLIPWSETIWDLDLFRWNMKKSIAYFGADSSTYDAARCWQPSKHIFRIVSGQDWPVDHDIPEEETLEYREKLRNERASYYRETKTLPRSTRLFLEFGPPPGNRNKALFLAALSLLEYGHSSEKVRELCLSAPGMNYHDKFETTLKSACRRAGVVY